MMAQSRKRCIECKRKLVLSRFYKSKRYADGREKTCGECRRSSVISLTATERNKLLDQWQEAPYKAAMRMLRNDPDLMKNIMEHNLTRFKNLTNIERGVILGSLEKILKEKGVSRPLSKGEISSVLLENTGVKK